MVTVMMMMMMMIVTNAESDDTQRRPSTELHHRNMASSNSAYRRPDHFHVSRTVSGIPSNSNAKKITEVSPPPSSGRFAHLKMPTTAKTDGQ